MATTLIAGGWVVDPASSEPARADVLIDGDKIAKVIKGDELAGERVAADVVIDAAERYIAPGFIDTHSHADSAVFSENVQLALLRQGITTVIGGQDGVSYAPGDGKYATAYFAAINGDHPTYQGPRVADLLDTYDQTTPINVAYLVPAGTVRFEVMGSENRSATESEIAQMVQLVQEALDDGAVGLSTGLDYVPGIFASTEELSSTTAPLAQSGLPYVTHMRGGYEKNSEFGVHEVSQIGLTANVPVHISHFHTEADEAWRLMEQLATQGVAASFDAYPYTRGCSILGMTMLPPEINAMEASEAVELLSQPSAREDIRRNWFPKVEQNPSLGPDWPTMITLAHINAPVYAWAHGKTLAEVAEREETDPIDAALDILVASRLQTNVVMAVKNQRPVSDLGKLISHPGHCGGSDGIFIGSHPHPRARGAFADYLGTYVREHGFLTWTEMVQHLSTGPAELFQLGDRGFIRENAIADIVLIDPQKVSAAATYDHPTLLAQGIDDVFVAGQQVLASGALTNRRSGCGIRAKPRKDI